MPLVVAITNFHVILVNNITPKYVSDIDGAQFHDPVIAARYHASIAKPARDPIVVQTAIPGCHFIVVDGIQRFVNDYTGYQTCSPAEARAYLVAIGHPNG